MNPESLPPLPAGAVRHTIRRACGTLELIFLPGGTEGTEPEALPANDADTLRAHRVDLMEKRGAAFDRGCYTLEALDAADDRERRAKGELRHAKRLLRRVRKQVACAKAAENAGLVGSTDRVERIEYRIDEAEARVRCAIIEVKASATDRDARDSECGDARDALDLAQDNAEAAGCPELGLEASL